MSNDPVLALFDIDGTLLSSGKGARRSLSQALEEVIEKPIKIKKWELAGKTDPLIIASFLERAGCLMHELQQLMSMVKHRYIELLKTNYNVKNDAYLYKGMPELLETISENTNIHLGLLTGNYREGARIKLEPFHVNPIFPVGAFGEDGFLRTDLSRVAVVRAADYYGIEFSPENIVVIGDTPADVECGKVINARTIAISRRKSKFSELERARPDHIFVDTDDTKEIYSAIINKD